MSKFPENELIQNLSVQEKRRLMRQIDQSSPKKMSSSRPSSGAAAKNFVTPKPFNGPASKQQLNRNVSPWISNVNSNASGNSSNSVFKPVRAPNGKSAKEADVMVPQLNQDHVKLFEVAAKRQEMKTGSEGSKRVSSAPKPTAGVSKVTKPVSALKTTPAPNKVNPVSRVGSPSSGNYAPRLSSASNNPTSKPTNNAYQSPYAQKQHHIAPQPKKSASPVANMSSGAGAKKSDPTIASSAKEEKSSITPQVKSTNNNASSESTKISSAQKSEPKSVSAAKPPTPLKSRASPFSKDTTQASPPTAVVAPMRERSKGILSNADKRPGVASNSVEAARQRSVSTPVMPKPKSNVVSYQSSSDDVILPDLSAVNDKSPETKMKRSMSEAVKVKNAVQKTKLGHDFQPHELKEWVNWCDACGSVILSLFGKCVSCKKCRMVCHGKCASTVSLTCEADEQLRSMTMTDDVLTFYKTIVQETKDERTLKEYNTIQRVITIEEVQEKIDEFNKTVKGSQQMTLQEDGETFRGFIRVSMNLTRPVSVMDSSKTTRKAPVARKASFYIDKGAVKALHLTSDTTAEQVVQALLMKYRISDNPMKFALFEKQVREEGHVILRKMLPRERPLFLRLLWGVGNSDKRGFILQENESRDIHWESFSVAELQMFIKILDKEENDYISDIKRKYKNKSQDIKMAMDYQQKLAAA
ncbi:unnamed protein product [Clavelina lepadiformis]|uniref:Uncharacterized protein n=1 Tax=Clavelina lepadiformis TaxID=159417 RepID=A0ABP0GDP0_CLALP